MTGVQTCALPIYATQRRIEQEQAAGRASVANPGAAGFALTWMTERTLYQQLVQANPIPQSELIDALTEIWVRAVYGSS